MLENLKPKAPDALLALIKLYNNDPRADKIDLGVGVYRTDTGATPVFKAIKAAEAALLAEQDSKSYLGPEGDMAFVEALMPYVFGAANPAMGGRIQGMQTPGGTGAVRLAAAAAKEAGVKRILLGMPSWPNHKQIMDDLGLETIGFNHAKADGTADLDAALDAIANAAEGDAILLHACCHNPTGIDYDNAGWDALAEALAKSPVFTIIDAAYQGLGRGMEEDAYGLRKVLSVLDEALIAYSCDKNFGLYRDRVGALYAMVSDAAQLPAIHSNLAAFARAAWSMPPDHGAAAVRYVLADAGRTQDWLAELDEMRARMLQVRARLAGADNDVPGLDMVPLGTQNGLFSMLALSPEQVLKMREDHAVYMAGSGRINIAGLTMGNIDKFIAALADVTA